MAVTAGPDVDLLEKGSLTMRMFLTLAGVLGVAVFALPAPARADVTGADVSSAGSSFLTAGPIGPDQDVHVDATTGDYLYWSFTATAGQQPDLTATITLPPPAGRHGAQSWTIEVFDGLRRRQPCVAGEQSPVAGTDVAQLALGCQLRQVRSWAEPQDGDPLPGTYYARLSGTDVPEADLGLPTQVDLRLALPKGDTGDDQGTLAAPLVPVNSPGHVVTGADTPSAAADDTTGDDDGHDWLPDLSSRWAWTIGGGVLAAITGLLGFGLTRRRRRTPA
jgi:hypothetical protein